METKFTLQELDQIIYNKLLFYLDRKKITVEPKKISDHTVEYLFYSKGTLLGVFKITQRADGVVEYIGNGAGNDDPELENSWFNLYYKMLIPVIEQEEQKVAESRSDELTQGDPIARSIRGEPDKFINSTDRLAFEIGKRALEASEQDAPQIRPQSERVDNPHALDGKCAELIACIVPGVQIPSLTIVSQALWRDATLRFAVTATRVIVEP